MAEKLKLVKHKTFQCGGLPDKTIIRAFLVSSKKTRNSTEYLIYCPAHCLFEDYIDSGVGSAILCKKVGQVYEVKHKNDRKFQGWRNVGDDDFIDFVSDYTGELSSKSEKQFLSTLKKIDETELKLAKKELKKLKKV